MQRGGMTCPLSHRLPLAEPSKMGLRLSGSRGHIHSQSSVLPGQSHHEGMAVRGQRAAWSRTGDTTGSEERRPLSKRVT